MAAILFASVMNGAAWGGSEELWSQTAVHLARAGHQVGCLAFDWAEKRARLESLAQAGCEILLLPNWGLPRRSLADRLLHEVLAKPAARLRARTVHWGRYDHVVVSQGQHEVGNGPLRNVYRWANRYSLVFHNYRDDHVFAPHRAERLRRLVRGAAHNFFASGHLRDVLEVKLSCAVPRAEVVHNPLSFPVPEAPAPFPEGRPARLVMLASLNLSAKAQDLAIEALAGSAWREREVVLDLYGQGPDEGKIRDRVRRLGLEQRVRLRGHTADPRGAIAGAHLLLQATRQDAMPLALSEAMALGRPSVVTDVGDMARWVEHGRTGFVAAAPDLAGVARALEEAWAARPRWAAMGLEARRTFEARHPRDASAAFAARILAPDGALAGAGQGRGWTT